MKQSLRITDIQRDMQLQPRSELNGNWVEEYALDIVSGATMPPVTVFFDNEKYWLADGFHRTYAAETLGLAEILADVREGSRRDALLFSLSANAAHGHRRTNDDKRRAVGIMLTDPEWSKWSDREIARQCAVDNSMVSRARPASVANPQIEPRRRTTRNGTTYDMNTAGIGKQVNIAVVDDDDGMIFEDYTSSPQHAPVFDHEAARIRREAIDPIIALADQPSPEDVIEAWSVSQEYGVPLETFARAIEWLAAFRDLWTHAEPLRQARIKRAKEMTHAAE